MTQLEDEDEQECVIEGDNCLICNTQVGEDDIYKDERSDLETICVDTYNNRWYITSQQLALQMRSLLLGLHKVSNY